MLTKRAIQAADCPAASPALPHLALPLSTTSGSTARVRSPPGRRPHATLLAADLPATLAAAWRRTGWRAGRQPPGILSRLTGPAAARRQAEEAARERGAPGQPPRASLLVVDSPAALAAGALGGARAGGTGHVLLACLGRAMRGLARRHLLAVLSTNHVVRGARARPTAA